MSFRRRLLLLFAVLVLVSVTAVALIIAFMVRRAFDRSNDERTATLVAQFRKEFNERGEDVARRVLAASSAPEAGRIALAAAQNSPNYNTFLDDAQIVAESQRLDFLEFCDDHGTIISSAQWPAKFGYKDPLAGSQAPAAAFLKEEETPSDSMLGLFAIRIVPAGERRLYVIGGVRLDTAFLSALDPPLDMHVMLYENLGAGGTGFVSSQLISATGSRDDVRQLAPLIARVQNHPGDASQVVHWESRPDETMNAFPLFGEKHQLLAILLVGSSRQIYTDLRNQIRSAALLAAGAGLLLATILAGWAAARVTKPLEQLAGAAREVAGGNWQTKVALDSRDEVGAVAASFNQMTAELLDQKQRLLQAERVAAWRELARRLAHELKNPLFPLQLTVENLLRARASGAQQFDETFHESATTLLSEIANLKSIIGRFSEFSKMPLPRFQRLRLDQVVENVVRVHHAQLDRAGISCRSQAPEAIEIAADPDLLHRAISNLVTNAIDAMPNGGTLTLRARQENDTAILEIADTGSGLTAEDCSRLFTPYYTSKADGTGLGLAITQSIVSDHGGTIRVTSSPGAGATFVIQLPSNSDKLAPAQGARA